MDGREITETIPEAELEDAIAYLQRSEAGTGRKAAGIVITELRALQAYCRPRPYRIRTGKWALEDGTTRHFAVADCPTCDGAITDASSMAEWGAMKYLQAKMEEEYRYCPLCSQRIRAPDTP